MWYIHHYFEPENHKTYQCHVDLGREKKEVQIDRKRWKWDTSSVNQSYSVSISSGPREKGKKGREKKFKEMGKRWKLDASGTTVNIKIIKLMTFTWTSRGIACCWYHLQQSGIISLSLYLRWHAPRSSLQRENCQPWPFVTGWLSLERNVASVGEKAWAFYDTRVIETVPVPVSSSQIATVAVVALGIHGISSLLLDSFGVLL